LRPVCVGSVIASGCAALWDDSWSTAGSIISATAARRKSISAAPTGCRAISMSGGSAGALRDEFLRERVRREILDAYLADNRKARILLRDATYIRHGSRCTAYGSANRLREQPRSALRLSDQCGRRQAGGGFCSAAASGEKAQGSGWKGAIIRHDYLFSSSRQRRRALRESQERREARARQGRHRAVCYVGRRWPRWMRRWTSSFQSAEALHADGFAGGNEMAMKASCKSKPRCVPRQLSRFPRLLEKYASQESIMVVGHNPISASSWAR